MTVRTLHDTLTTIRVDLSVPARDLNNACQDLADQATTFGLEDHLDTMQRVAFAANCFFE